MTVVPRLAYLHLGDKWFHNHYVLPLASCPFWTLHHGTHESTTLLVAVPEDT